MPTRLETLKRYSNALLQHAQGSEVDPNMIRAQFAIEQSTHPSQEYSQAIEVMDNLEGLMKILLAKNTHIDSLERKLSLQHYTSPANLPRNLRMTFQERMEILEKLSTLTWSDCPKIESYSDEATGTLLSTGFDFYVSEEKFVRILTYTDDCIDERAKDGLGDFAIYPESGSPVRACFSYDQDTGRWFERSPESRSSEALLWCCENLRDSLNKLKNSMRLFA